MCRVPVQDSCSIVYSLPAAAPLQQYPRPRSQWGRCRRPGSLSLPTANLWHARDFAAKTFFLIQINKSKVLPPSSPPLGTGAGSSGHGEEVSGPAGGSRGEGERDLCSLLCLVMELIKQALQSFNSTKPAGDNGMQGEGGEEGSE